MNLRILFLTPLQPSNLLTSENTLELRDVSDESDETSSEENNSSKSRHWLRSIGYALAGIAVGSLSSKQLRYSLRFLKESITKDNIEKGRASYYYHNPQKSLTTRGSYHEAALINLKNISIVRNMTIGGLVGLCASFMHYRYQVQDDSNQSLYEEES